MNILRVAFKKSPKEAAKIMAAIYEDDAKIAAICFSGNFFGL